MYAVPGTPDGFGMSPIGLQDVSPGAGRRFVHIGSTVELYPAHILVAEPDMNVRRFEGVLSGVHDKAEVPLCRNRRHPELSLSIASHTECIIYDTPVKGTSGERRSPQRGQRREVGVIIGLSRLLMLS